MIFVVRVIIFKAYANFNLHLLVDKKTIMDAKIQEYCWKVSLGHEFKEKLVPFVTPRLKQILGFIGLSIRYLKYHRECSKKNIQPHMDFFSPLQLKQIYGVPCGGIGTGTIGRSYTGDFTRYQLLPGIYEHEKVDSNLFTVCIRKKSSTHYQQTLCTRHSTQKGLRAWNMAYCGDNATYHALYPESWTVYNLPGQNVTLTCHQLSPVIPHNYKDSSLPTTLFNWTVENTNKEDIDLSLMFTWQAGSASDKFELTDVSSRSFKDFTNFNTSISGVAISQKLRGMPLEYCIAARNSENCKVTYNCQWYPDNEASGSAVWSDLLDDGHLNNVECKLYFNYYKLSLRIIFFLRITKFYCFKITKKTCLRNQS